MPKVDVTTEVESNTFEVKKELATSVKNILNALGLSLERHAKENAPVGTPESTGIPYYIGGNLRNSITYQTDEEQKCVIVGTNVEYAEAQELGTSKGIKPKHYLTRAVTEHEDEYKAIIEAGLQD